MRRWLGWSPTEPGHRLARKRSKRKKIPAWVGGVIGHDFGHNGRQDWSQNVSPRVRKVSKARIDGVRLATGQKMAERDRNAIGRNDVAGSDHCTMMVGGNFKISASMRGSF